MFTKISKQACTRTRFTGRIDCLGEIMCWWHNRRMRDPCFRQQLDGLRAPHVAPINALVDD